MIEYCISQNLQNKIASKLETSDQEQIKAFITLSILEKLATLSKPADFQRGYRAAFDDLLVELGRDDCVVGSVGKELLREIRLACNLLDGQNRNKAVQELDAQPT